MIEKQRQDFYRQQPVRLPAKSVAKAKVPSRRKAITAYWISVRYDDSDDERHLHYSLGSHFDCPDNKWRLCCGWRTTLAFLEAIPAASRWVATERALLSSIFSWSRPLQPVSRSIHPLHYVSFVWWFGYVIGDAFHSFFFARDEHQRWTIWSVWSERITDLIDLPIPLAVTSE